MSYRRIGWLLSLGLHAAAITSYVAWHNTGQHSTTAATATNTVLRLSMFQTPPTAQAEPEASDAAQQSAKPPSKPQAELAVPNAPAPEHTTEQAPDSAVDAHQQITAEAPAKDAPKPPATAPKPKAKPSASNTKATARRADAQSLPKPASAPTPPPATEPGQGLSDQQRSAVENAYKNALRSAIFARQQYPRKARRKRQEGVVEVSLTILANGDFDALELMASSGVASLDAAAMAALRDLNRFQPLPPELGRKRWQLTVPIVFKH